MKALVSIVAVAALIMGAVSPAQALEVLPEVCTITGDQYSNVIYGTEGDDVICALGGSDTIYGLGGDDQIYGGTGNDYLAGDSGSDKLYAGEGRDNLYGNEGIDNLFGGAGNDGLTGGAGVDILRGEDGVDTCVSFTGDNYLKADCFYDKALPRVTDVHFTRANLNVDATKTQTYLAIDATISDLGAGLKTLWFGFAKKSTIGEGSIGFSAVLTDLVTTCQSLEEHNARVDPEFEVEVSNCKVSGTTNSGVFRTKVKLPKNMEKTRWAMSEFKVEDQALNSKYYEYADLKKMGLSLEFSQIGTPDTAAPVLISTDIIGSNVLESRTDEIKVHIQIRDYGNNGVTGFSVNYETVDSGYANDPGMQQYFDATQLYSCDQEYHKVGACLFSGTPSNGVYEFKINLDPNWHDVTYLTRAQKFVPTEYSITDKLDNNIQLPLSKDLAAGLTFHKGYASAPRVDDKDKTAPTLAGLSVDRRSVDTGSDAQVVNAKVRIKDVGVGVDPYANGIQLELSNSDGFGISVICEPVGIATGKATDLTFKFRCELPAHVQLGKYFFHLNVADRSMRANNSYVDPTKIKRLGFVDYVLNAAA